MINPYVWRGPVRNMEMFFGRTQELHQLSAFIGGCQSISIIGPRKIGKTSLLFQLMRSDIWSQYNISLQTLMTYLDCEVFSEASPTDIFQTFASELIQTLDEGDLPPEPALEKAAEKPTRLAFEAAVRKLSQRELRLVLILDEFEKLSSNGNLDINFFNALRAVAGRYPLVFITSSASSLLDLTYANRSQEILSSPFFNIFANLFLGLLPEEEARDLLRKPLAGSEQSFSPELEEHLYQQAGGHPFVLQVSCFHALEQGGEREAAEYSANRELEAHFRYYWKNLSVAEREILRVIPKVSSTNTSGTQIRSLLRDLTQKCLLLKAGDGYRYPYAAWAQFIEYLSYEGAVYNDQTVATLETVVGVQDVAQFHPKDKTPSILGCYEIISSIGRGAMGEVYKGIHPRLKRNVAIKVLRPYLAAEDDFRRRFELEAQVVASLRHPHIVQVYDFGENDGVYYMVMEFIEGVDLTEYLLKSGPLSLSLGRQLLRDVASALDHAHGHDLIHRDVKSSNVLMDMASAQGGSQPRAVLTDFGLTKMLKSNAAMTQPGRLLGTPAYMAPELVIAHKKIDKQVDIYALGVLAYLVLTGGLPFDDESALGSLWGHLQRPPPDPRLAAPDLPEEVALAIQRAMSKDPRKRFASAGALVEALG